MQTDENNAQVILALDVGGTFIKSALFRGGELQHLLPQIPSCSGGGAEEIGSALRRVVRAAGRIDGIGIAIPGPFDYRNGVSLMEHKFRAIKGKSLFEFLPGVPVRFIHDANAFLLGERKNERRIGGVTLGTGIGAAVMIDGELLTDELGSPAKEVSLWSRPFRDTTVEKALKLREHGPGQPPEVWREFGALLAEILTPWRETFQLESIALGGQIARDFDRFKGPLAGLPVRQSVQGELSALSGAAKQFHIG